MLFQTAAVHLKSLEHRPPENEEDFALEETLGYLCRIIDMLHMGFVDEVIFGREVLTRLPEVAREWLG